MLSEHEWFSEISDLWHGQAFSLKIKKTIADFNSKYQRIQVIETDSIWKKVLVLDGIVQLTEYDEFVYHEMLTHIPLVSHPNPRKVLVVGGGDGGVVREICRYACIAEIHVCEIDEEVINVSKQYFPSISAGFDDPRVKIHIEDASEFIKKYKNYFDVIICDCSDPIGPAEILFQKSFYTSVFESLSYNGIYISQMENFWLNIDFLKQEVRMAKQIFEIVEYGQIYIPTYTCGSIGFLCCSKALKCSDSPHKSIDFDLKYYTKEFHKAAFILPKFIENSIDA